MDAPDAPDFRFETLLAAFASCADDPARRAFLLAHPVFLHERFVGALCSGDTKVAVAFARAVQALNVQVSLNDDGHVGSVTLDAERWPIGGGPLEAVWKQLEAFEISTEQAVLLVRAPAVCDELTLGYVKALSAHTDQLLRAGRAAQALGRQRLVVQAAQALGDRPVLTSDHDVWRSRFVAMHGWLQITSRVLTTVADPRLLREALVSGVQMLAQAQVRIDVLVEERIAQRLGMLYLDPYTADRDLSDSESPHG